MWLRPLERLCGRCWASRILSVPTQERLPNGGTPLSLVLLRVVYTSDSESCD